jgi:tRNA(fMet)-specific endonuclease VapC
LRYLLDTNVCVTYLRGKSAKLKVRLETAVPSEVCICSVVKGELLCGAWKSNRVKENLQRSTQFWAAIKSLPFNDAAAEIYAENRARLEKVGLKIGPNDLQIAAIALANNLILVTHNTSEFGRVAGLKIEDWQI